MFFTESERLKLIPLSYEQLLLLNKDRLVLEKSLNLNPSAMIIDPLFQAEIDDALQGFWLPNTLAYPDLYHWYTNWEVILKSANTAIGGICFGGYPNDHGETSLGYMIDRQHWGQGYATEALKTLTQWGFGFSLLKAIVADTHSNNKASARVMLKAGFKVTHTDNEKVYFKLSKP